MIGAGRLGASLALALCAQGAPLLAFTAATPPGRTRAETWLGGQAMGHIADVVAREPEFYVLAVPDRALPEVAQELGAELATRAHTKPPVVAHTSGATSVAVLAPCRHAGATTLVFHPLQTFSDPPTGAMRFAGAAIAITPAVFRQNSTAAAFGFALAHLLGAHPFLLSDDHRTLYHTAATFACNYLVTIQHCAKDLFVKAGLPEKKALSLFLPLVRATLDNLSTQGTVGALTGPLSRGDVLTVASHLDALATDAPHLLPLYQALGVATLPLVQARGDVDPQLMARLAQLVGADMGQLYQGTPEPELDSGEPGT